MQGHPNQLIQVAVTAVVVVLVLFLRIRRMSQLRPLRLEQLWIVPAIYLVLVVLIFAKGALPGPTGWAICAGTFVLGCLLGWQRGRMMHIAVDPETHSLNQKASFASLLFIVALVAVKFGAQAEGASLHLDVGLITEALAMLGLGLFTAMRVEMYFRAKRLLDEAGAR